MVTSSPAPRHCSLRHHGDDPEAIRVGLELSNIISPHRDVLLAGFLASAKGREARGLARLALAQYLEQKAQMAAFVRKQSGRRKMVYSGLLGDDGKLFDKEIEQSDEEYAYDLLLRQCDPDALRAEAERLYEEVIAGYADVPLITVQLRKTGGPAQAAVRDVERQADHGRGSASRRGDARAKADARPGRRGPAR